MGAFAPLVELTIHSHPMTLLMTPQEQQDDDLSRSERWWSGVEGLWEGGMWGRRRRRCGLGCRANMVIPQALQESLCVMRGAFVVCLSPEYLEWNTGMMFDRCSPPATQEISAYSEHHERRMCSRLFVALTERLSKSSSRSPWSLYTASVTA